MGNTEQYWKGERRATKKPKDCSVKRSEHELTPSEISIETQGQRRSKVEGQKVEQIPWFVVPKLREQKQRWR